ncbi:hypothetical protein EET67_06715 [Pseudaminobacter arsenicus]|uniref:D-glucuronyl C5-epimerase C-terminal domain-containing protein n=1 Tax=Borborobacter arsenicus TaxID=1851146 RepID=A0A432V860_9HYPH|nr:D-glucuronyl C5-epimerase family protein [Pseudaminobacter arsenicus]RUM98326.1 hypothetical protein EET67_06715 [Pseudaminobacter arsenicus]
MFPKLAIVAVVAALSMVCSVASASNRIVDAPTENLGTFLWDNRPSSEMTDAYIQDAIGRHDPFQIFFGLFRAIRDSHLKGESARLESALSFLDFMIDEYEPAVRDGLGVRYRYGYAHNKIDPGWWSGMDGFSAPMTMYAAWEITGKERYRSAALATAKLALQSPLDGGSVWRSEKGCWISEYSWTGMSEEDEYHVLNGHLFGLHALLLLANASQDKDLLEAYDCAARGTKTMADDFIRADRKWTWYQSTPKVIIPVNYLLFESAEFESLFNLTGDPFYREQVGLRRSLFAQEYPLALISGEKGFRVVAKALGAPHPYLPDVYPYRIECEVLGQTVSADHRQMHYKNLDLSQRLVTSLQVPSRPDRCDYSILRGDMTVKVFSQTEFPEVADQPLTLDLKPEAQLDAVAIDGNTITISPEFKASPNKETAANDEARIVFDAPADWQPGSLFAFIAQPDFNAAIAFLLVDSQGNTASRGYPMLKADCENLIMLAPVGFENEGTIGGDRELKFRIFTQDLDSDKSIVLSDYALLSGPADVATYIAAHKDACYRQNTLID